MLRPRIVPCLLIHDGGLVKTVRFKDPKYVGDPINAVRIFNEKDADELIVLDIDASRIGREPDYQKIRYIASECRMPFCYGGGVRTAVQAARIVSLGVEKVAVSAAAIERPELVGEIAQEVGSQSVVVVLDVKKKLLGRGYEVWIHNGKKNSKRNVMDLLGTVQNGGAGEVVINFIDRDGMQSGFDLDAIEAFHREVRIPMTVIGGAGSLTDIGDVVERCGLIGVSAGSLFVFKGPYKAVLINYPDVDAKREHVYSRMPASSGISAN